MLLVLLTNEEHKKIVKRGRRCFLPKVQAQPSDGRVETTIHALDQPSLPLSCMNILPISLFTQEAPAARIHRRTQHSTARVRLILLACWSGFDHNHQHRDSSPPFYRVMKH